MFIHVWIEMGIVRRSNYKDHWNNKGGNNYIKSIMGVNNWSLIYRALYHLNDDTLENLEQDFNNNFQKYWTPSQSMCIDETMRLFKGWSKHKNYNKVCLVATVNPLTAEHKN